MLALVLVLGLVLGCCEAGWQCNAVRRVAVTSSVAYTAWNCTGSGGSWRVGPTLMHVVLANLSSVLASPIVDDQLASLSDMVSGVDPAAAVNGGFFWEINRKTFIDNVCFTKSHEDALAPVSMGSPNHGVGDTLVR